MQRARRLFVKLLVTLPTLDGTHRTRELFEQPPPSPLIGVHRLAILSHSSEMKRLIVAKSNAAHGFQPDRVRQ